MGTSVMPQIGHLPGVGERTSGCIAHQYASGPMPVSCTISTVRPPGAATRIDSAPRESTRVPLAVRRDTIGAGSDEPTPTSAMSSGNEAAFADIGTRFSDASLDQCAWSRSQFRSATGSATAISARIVAASPDPSTVTRPRTVGDVAGSLFLSKSRYAVPQRTPTPTPCTIVFVQRFDVA